MFDNFINLYGSFIISYGYNHKNNLITLTYNCHGTYQLKFIFMSFISLIIIFLGLIMNDYDHCYELVLLQTMI